MNIFMVASESNPICKTGGLADVIWSMSRELSRLGEDVSVVIPFYKCIKDLPGFRIKRLGRYDVELSWRRQPAEVYMHDFDGVKFYLIANDYYFNRENLYGYEDDGERFAFFSLAVRSMFGRLDLVPDIVHVHDWQPGMVPVLIKEGCKEDPRFANTRFVLTLHNEAFKGYLDRYFLNHFYGLDDRLFDEGMVRFDGMLSTLKAGIVYADKVVAVSPTHARELLSPGDPMRLDGVLRMRGSDFKGIVNGVDQNEFDPETDPFIPLNYSAKTVVSGKKECRKKLLSSANLDDDDAPVFGIVSRLTYQKGIDLALALAEELLAAGCKIFILGTGEFELEQRVEELHDRYPETCAVYRGYNNQLAHDIYAGADFFLMPSLFEPCGIGQMIAQRYGTLPICRAVGGLKDTVVNFDGTNVKEATGFLFEDYELSSFREACSRALAAFSSAKIMKQLILNAMKADHSWNRGALEYIELYRSALNK